ncbi:hypothetical protein BD626DRAFT_498311 [Schizophyllum amplum]|uniref:Uncharacterized protein n=1 Tax=Schizophyllum amplum TaxID=97359 RepID=A0A550CD88_9AGAR|nr:hypothetical protein BD626DRAFT_498311 [Auriculariopsis ampla]
MSDSIEMDDLSKTQKTQTENTESLLDGMNTPDGAVSTWSWIAAGLFSLLAAILTLSPRLLLFLSEVSADDDRRRVLTPLEAFLSMHFGIWLAALAVSVLLNMPSSDPVPSQQPNTHYHPLLGPVAVAGDLSAFLAWNNKSVGSLATLVSFLAGLIGLWGTWTIVFAGTSSISRKTGADKHTSSLLFGNKNAASVQKKKWKKEHKVHQ